LKAWQTDRSPTIGASWKDLRHVINPVALTIDVRKSLWLKWWDKIMIQDTNWKNHIVQIEDEMNSRFRNTWPSNCVKPTNWNKHCIKMDIVEQFIPSWEYKLIKKM
jgi:hypothetical protein